MRIKVDILDYVTGGVLSMECKNRRWKPVVFLLKSLNEIERNYEIYNKEMLAIIKGWKTGDIYWKVPSSSLRSG